MTRARSRVGVAVAATLVALGVVVLGGSTMPAGAEGEDATYHLRPGDIFTTTLKSVNVPDLGSAFVTPADCRDGAPTCDVVRVYLERDESEGALNFLRVELNWEGGAQPPDLALVVAGLGSAPVNDLDMYVYDSKEKRVEGTGGVSAAALEVAGIIAEDDYYDLVISQFSGVTTEYTLNFIYSNEKFVPPFEALDPSNGGGAASFTPPTDRSGDASPSAGFDAGSSSASVVGDFASAPGVGAGAGVIPAPLAPDSDFSGFRRTVDDQLAAPLVGSPASRVTDRVSPPPGAAEVIFWLLFVPVAVAAGIFVLMRRRRAAAIGS